MEASTADKGHDSQSLLEENRRLTEELAQCKTDKEFVWSLWKQLQKESPDMTATVDMVVTREKLKSEQRNQKVMAILQEKEKEIASLNSLMAAKQEESADQELRLKRMESEVTLLEKKLEAQQLEIQQAAVEKQEVFEEAQGIKERCKELEVASQEALRREQGLMEELSRLKGEIIEKEKMAQEQARKEEQIEALQEELSTLGSRMADLSSECSACVERCKELDLQLKSKRQQLQKEREEGKRKDSQIQRLRDELIEVGRSRDSWANHTTLQNSSLQRIQEENGQLRADIAVKEEKLTSLSETLQQLSIQLKEARGQKTHYESECHHLEVQLGEARTAGAPTGELDQSTDRPQYAPGEGIDSVDKMKKNLERTEGELFEARMQLQTKMEELQCLRSSHDRRLQRMQALQENHRLVLEQLRTYEAKSSPSKKRLQFNSRQHAKTLRQESSEAVWNELSHYKSRCKELEEQVIHAEEERDTLQTKCLRNQTTITELRLCLQHERDDLQSKITAVVDLESTTSTSSIQDSKVINLEKQVAQLQHEKRKLLTQLKVAEKKCYELRESGVEMQSTIMQYKHKLQVKKLKTFSKSTMTDVTPEDTTTTPKDTSSFTDSATQVDLIVSPAKHPPELKDTSPCLDWKPPATLNVKEVSPSSQELVHKRSYRHTHHYRAHSDGEILLHKRRAKDALEKMHYLSRTLQQGSPRKVQEGNATIRNSTDDGSLEANTATAETPKKECSTQPGITGHEYAHSRSAHAPDSATKQSEECSRAKKKPRNTSAAPHKCVWQQQVKSLQQRLKTLTKQVMVLNASKQSLSQGLEVERAAKEKARGEARELGQKLQSYRTSLQSLQEEAQKLRETNQELQQKCSSFELEKARVCTADSGQEKRGRSESEWKKAEAERKALSDNCATLSATVKSLEEQLNIKSGVLRIVQERCARFERDVKQKRQLVEDQRQKLKQAKDCSTEEQEKMHKLAAEVLTLNEALGQNKHKVELLRLQLNKQAKDKEGLSATLNKCQEELAHTLQQLSNCQEQCEKKKQVALQMKQLFQHKEEELHRRQSERISQLEKHLKAQQKQLHEFYQFTEMLAVDLEQQVLSRKEFKQRKRHEKAAVECGDEGSSSAVSLRVREIARSAFNFSDLDIDEFFSDVDATDKQGARPRHGFVDCVKAAMSKPQFAAQLVKNFTDFVGQMLE